MYVRMLVCAAFSETFIIILYKYKKQAHVEIFVHVLV